MNITNVWYFLKSRILKETFRRPRTISTHHIMFNLKKLGKKLILPTNTKVVHQENCGHKLHLKVQNTEHIGSDSISKVQNSNSKQTEVFESGNDFFINVSFRISFFLDLEFHFEADHCKSGTPLGSDWYFKGLCFLDAIVKGKWKNDEENCLLNKISKVHGFPDAF
ncbi:hypothetical protein RclHR1_02400019 [Rhizophagus clarus]|uniref:Uncharacterized protein n=1 Tax=Rhizophagus clarus TaxID=94130 RepID=A0A2Z6QWQ8_9GLOM|nr:hypothetical protein RclHR1_02400019 [Rhizophagus clarus]